MWIENIRVPFEKTGRITLHPLGDWQLDSESCDKKLIRYAVEEVCDDPSGGMSVFLGDIEDDDRPSTRIKKVQAFADRVEVLTANGRDHLTWLDKEIIPLMVPLAKTRRGIVGMLAGHHWTQLTSNLNSVQYLCNRLGALSGRKIPYFGQMSAWLRLKFRHSKNHGSVTKLVHIQHGEGGGQTLASALNKLELTSRAFEADALIRAHDCKLVAAKFDRLYPKDSDNPILLSKTVALLNVGSATRGYHITTEAPDYVEAKMMRPTTMGWGKMHFDIRKAYLHEDISQNWIANIKVEI